MNSVVTEKDRKKDKLLVLIINLQYYEWFSIITFYGDLQSYFTLTPHRIRTGIGYGFGVLSQN